MPLVVDADATEQAHVAMGWWGVDSDDDDRYPLTVANQVLGGGMSSRLFQEVREERGLCYSVYSWASTYADAGTAGVYAGTAPARVGELLEVVDDEIAKIVASGVSEAELAVAKGFIEGSLRVGPGGFRLAHGPVGSQPHGPRRGRARRRAAGPRRRGDRRRRRPRAPASSAASAPSPSSAPSTSRSSPEGRWCNLGPSRVPCACLDALRLLM